MERIVLIAVACVSVQAVTPATGAAGAAGETVALEGECMKALKGEELVRGFDRGVSYVAPVKGTARGRVRVSVADRLARRDTAALQQAASEFLGHQDVLAVSILGAEGQALAQARRQDARRRGGQACNSQNGGGKITWWG